MNRNRREHGAITVFLSFVMASIIAFMGMLVDVARLRVSEAQIKRAAQLSLDAAMTQYSRRLREDYGIYGYAGLQDFGTLYNQYFTANLRPDAEKKQGAFYTLLNQFTGGRIKYGDMLKLATDQDASAAVGSDPLSDPDILYRQIVEFSKFRIPLTLALSGRLSDLTKVVSAVEDGRNNMESANETMKLAKPMEEYTDGERELEAAVQALNEAIDKINAAIDQWNTLVNAGEDGWSVQNTVPIGWYSWEPDDPAYLIRRYPRYVDDGGYAYPLSFGPMPFYDVSAAADAIRYIREHLATDMSREVFRDFDNAMSYQADSIERMKERAREAEAAYYAAADDDSNLEDYKKEYADYLNRIREMEDNLSDVMQHRRNDQEIFEQEMDFTLDGKLGALLDMAAISIDDITGVRRGSREEQRKNMESAISRAEKAIEDLEQTRQEARDTMDEVSENLQRRQEQGKCSDEIANSWKNGKDGDADLAEQTLKDDEARIEALKPRLEEVKQWLETYKQRDAEIQQADIPRLALRVADHHGSVSPESWDPSLTWEPSRYALKKADGDDPEYEPFPDEDEYEERMRKANEDAEARMRASSETAAADAVSEVQRYNPEPISRKYGSLLVTDSETAGDTPLTKPRNAGRDARESDATGKSQEMSDVMGGIAATIGGSLLNTIGGVYAAEYILRMFSNAAPEQEDNHCPENAADFKYAHITTLRNQRPVGLPEYQSWKGGDGTEAPRLDYFYNAEVEYILFGNPQEQFNVTRARVMLEAILVVSNYLQVRSSAELRGIADAAAAAAALVGVPTVVTRFLVLMGFAFAETALDMHYLMRGYRIPAFSVDPADLFLTNPDANAILERETTLKISYEFYLRLRLLLAMLLNSRDVMRRTASLIQVNVRYAADQGVSSYASDAGFDIQQAYTTFSGAASGRMPWWFMTQAIMGPNRTEDGWAVIPEYRIVTSY